MAPLQELLTTSRAAPYIGVTETTLRRWTRNGRVPFVKLPSGQLRFRVSDLDAMITVTEATASKAS